MVKREVYDVFGNVIENKLPILDMACDDKINIVCDMDGTASWLTRKICERRGLDFNKWINYDISKTLFNPEEQQIIKQDFGSYEAFKYAGVMDGIESIGQLIADRDRIRFLFHTLSYKEDVVRAKEEIIADQMQFLREEEVWLELGGAKTIVRNVHIAIDDSPRAFEISDAELKIMIRQRYNEDWYMRIGKEIKVVPCDDIVHATQIAREYIYR